MCCPAHRAAEASADFGMAARCPCGCAQVLHEQERINRSVATAEATYLQHPPYPKSGGGVKNVEFSYMKSG